MGYITHPYPDVNDALIETAMGLLPDTWNYGLRVVHAPGMPGTFSPAADLKETAS